MYPSEDSQSPFLNVATISTPSHQLAIPIHRLCQHIAGALFHTRVSGVGHDHHIGMWHDVIEFKGGFARTDDIVATVDNSGRNVVQLFGTVQQIVLVGQERLIDEVMGFNSSDGERGFPIFWYSVIPITLIRNELRYRRFPDIPLPSRFETGEFIVAGEIFVITFNRGFVALLG